MLLERDAVAEENRWNVEALYPTFDDWQTEFEHVNRTTAPRWPELAAYRGRLSENPETLKAALELQFSVERALTKLHTYAHLRHDEDIADDSFKAAYQKITALYYDFAHESAWFEPELLEVDAALLENLLKSSQLAEYRFHLEKIIRVKKHMLSPDQEALLALSANAMQSSSKAFSAMNDADLDFGCVSDSRGVSHPLTHAQYGVYIRDQDRVLRANTFKTLNGKYQEYENTLCELLNGQVQTHLFNAKARHYESCLEAALFPKNIEVDVYHSLINAVNDEISALHDYFELRAKVQKFPSLHLYDMYVPLMEDVEMKMSYQEAEDVVIQSVAPLGAEYQSLLRKGMKEQRWVDRHEKKIKRSGAYSSGCYDSVPYILMNYKETIKNVFTLAHEAGHSMHSLLTHTNQPYQYGNYPIFLAEVASTFNEELLMQELVKRAKTKAEKIFLINEKIEDIRGTLFRQTMFAEFELLIHTFAEKNIPLTPKMLKEEYRKLNAKYFGPAVTLDVEAEMEWARIPHFYYNFYVFQYSTGISAALALADRVTQGGEKERQDYLSFLKGGSSLYPIEMLKKAGVDMRTPEPVKAAIGKFRLLVTELKGLLEV
jgi:oligoendopeptidase F